MGVYDDQKTTPGTDDLNALTGISPVAEGAMEGQAQVGAREDLAAREQNPASANGATSAGATGGAGLAAAESIKDGVDQLGKGFNPASGGVAFKMLLKNNRKKGVIGGLVSGLIALIIVVMGISSGPLQLIHLSEILQKNFRGSEDASQKRTNGLFRYARSGGVGETRVSWLGSKTFAKTINQLSDIGITFERDGLDRIKSMSIDTEKLAKAYPELKNMSPSEQRSFLLETFPEVGKGELQQINGIKGKYAVNTRDFGVKATRPLIENSVAALDDGKLVSAIKTHSLARFFDNPTMWHPLKRLASNQEKKATAVFDAKKLKKAEEERVKANEKPTIDKGTKASSSIKSNIKGPKAIAGAALITTAAVCLVRSVADDVVVVNQAQIVGPSVLKAADKIAIGSQIKSGRDLSADQVGTISQSLTDANGKTVWQSRGLQLLSGNGNVGEDIPYDVKQAFSNETTAEKIKDTVSLSIGDVDLGAAACSKPGLIIQGVAGVGLAVGAIVGGIPSGGASVAAYVAYSAGKITTGMAVTAGALYFLEKNLTTIFADKAILPELASGPIGGNVLAFGARAAAGTDARSSGGVALDGTQTAVLPKELQDKENKEFQSKSLYAKIFDAKDYRSLSGRLADSVSPSFSQNTASFVGTLTNIGSLLPKAFSSLIPNASAATQSYDWGFPIYGIPNDMLNNPDFEDPYDNADRVAAILDGPNHDTYVEKAKNCFGVDINKGVNGWDVEYKDAVNPNEGKYVDAKCNDLSDTAWKRMMLFVFDTKTMKAAACYENDDQSCQDIGAGAASATSSGTTVAGEGAARIASVAEAEFAKNGNKVLEICGQNCGPEVIKYTGGPTGPSAPWCAWFVSWVYREAGYEFKGSPANARGDLPAVEGLISWFKQNGIHYTPSSNQYSPQPGDVIMYGRGTHTGVVVKVTGDNIETIEGNTSADGNFNANGGTVGRKSFNYKTYTARTIEFGRLKGL